MRLVHLLATAALACVPSASLRGQAAPAPGGTPETTTQRAPAAAASVTARGCLEAGADGKTFLLRNVESAPGTVDSGTTSPAAGTSATGDAPSGSVTGRTPTGSTADVTPAPVPDAGTPGEAASPASPTFRQPAAAGTTGSVAGSDSRSREYRLVPGSNVDLQAHVGHTVEVSGAVRAAAATSQGATAGNADVQKAPEKAAQTQPSSIAQPRPVQTLVVERLRHIRPSCAP